MLCMHNMMPMPLQARCQAARLAPCSRYSLRTPYTSVTALRTRKVAARAVASDISKSASKTGGPESFVPSDLIKVTFPDDDDFDNLEKNVTADICYPKGNDGNPATPTGAIVFMHGFSQMPKSYFRTIQDLVARGYIIIAPYGGREALTGDGSLQDPKIQAIARKIPADRPETSRKGLFAFPDPGAKLRYATQLALKQDGQQCIKFVTKPDAAKFKKEGSDELEPLSTYLPKGASSIGMCGHSMGAGLSFSLAAENPRVTAIGVMAPMIRLEDEFEPLKWVDKSSFKDKSVLLLSGSWDFIAPPSDVDKLYKRIEASASKKDNEAEYKELPQYFHTTFEDQLTLGDLTLTSAVAVALGVLYWAVQAASADGLSGWEVWLQRLEILLLVAYVYLVDVRPKFIQGKESRELMINFFTSKL